jgi:hypothetical protein
MYIISIYLNKLKVFRDEICTLMKEEDRREVEGAIGMKIKL